MVMGAATRPQSARPHPSGNESLLPASGMRERPRSARPRESQSKTDWDSRAYVMYATNPLSPYAGPILAQLRVGSAAEVVVDSSADGTLHRATPPPHEPHCSHCPHCLRGLGGALVDRAGAAGKPAHLLPTRPRVAFSLLSRGSQSYGLHRTNTLGDH
jgi:hypothetical protein